MHAAGAAVAADQIICLKLRGRAVAAPDLGAHGLGVLREGDEFATIAHGHAGQGFGDRLEQRLQRVLRDELVGLKRHRPVVAGRDLGLRLWRPRDRAGAEAAARSAR